MASVLASLLTLCYVGGGVPESNPVIAALAARVGLHATVALRTLVLVACFWGYAVVARALSVPRLATTFGWLGAAVNLLDAAGNAFAALHLGPPPAPVAASGWFLLGALFGAALLARPPDPARAHRA